MLRGACPKNNTVLRIRAATWAVAVVPCAKRFIANSINPEPRGKLATAAPDNARSIRLG